MSENKSSADSPFCDPSPSMMLAGNRSRVLVLNHLSKDIVVIRYLISKIVFSEDPFSLEEGIFLFNSFENLLLKFNDDRQLQRKYGLEVFTFRAVFQSLTHIVEFSREERRKIREEYSFYKGKLFGERIYKSIKGQIIKSFEVKFKTRFPTKIPPKPYIGIGYRDKGNAKKIELDNSPSWMEVCSSETSREAPKFNIDRRHVNWIFDQFAVNEVQRFRTKGVREDRTSKNRK